MPFKRFSSFAIIILFQYLTSHTLRLYTRLLINLPNHTDTKFVHPKQYRHMQTLAEIEVIFEYMLKIFNKMSNTYNIQYIVTQGGLLGIHRYDHLLYWDEDIDIALINHNESLHFFTQNTNSFLLNNTLYITDKKPINDKIWQWWNVNTTQRYILYFRDSFSIQLCHFSGLRVDVGNLQNIAYSSSLSTQAIKDIVFPVQKCSIHSNANIAKYSYCPRKVESFLELRFGSDLHESLFLTFQMEIYFFSALFLFCISCYLCFKLNVSNRFYLTSKCTSMSAYKNMMKKYRNKYNANNILSIIVNNLIFVTIFYVLTIILACMGSDLRGYHCVSWFSFFDFHDYK